MSLYTPADVPLQKKLLDPDNITTTVHDDFLREFAEVVGGRWPSLASIKTRKIRTGSDLR